MAKGGKSIAAFILTFACASASCWASEAAFEKLKVQVVIEPSTKLSETSELPNDPVSLQLSPFVGSKDFVQISEQNRFRFRGQPYFPIMIWGVPADTEEMFATARDFGFNLVLNVTEAYGEVGAKLALDMAEKYELKVMALTRVDMDEKQLPSLPEKFRRLGRVVNEIRSHPALFAYFLSDEPVWRGLNLKAFGEGAQLIRKLDPNHPLYVNHAPRNTVEELRRFNQYADFAGSDIYPVWAGGIDRHSDLPNKSISVVGDETVKNFMAVDQRKPVMQTLQGFSWSDGQTTTKRSGDPFPSEEQMRFMAYDSVVSGASGLTFFQDHRYAKLRPELKPVIREFHALQDVLAGGKNLRARVIGAQSGIKVLVREYRGSVVAIAINSANQQTLVEFDVSQLSESTSTSVQVLFEKRQLVLNAGQYRDSLLPWAVHVYLLSNDNAPRILRTVEPLKIAPRQVSNVQAKYDALVPDKDRNLALAAKGVRAFASSEHMGMPASIVIDGDRWGKQWNDDSMNEYPDWVELVFPRPTLLSKIAIFTRQMALFGEWYQQGIRDFNVQIEQDGEWRAIRDIRDNESFVSIIDFDPVATTKIRVSITATNGMGDYSRVLEIEAYGPKSN